MDQVRLRTVGWRGALVVALALVTLAVGGTPAKADPFGYPAQGYVADGADHWYCINTGMDTDNVNRINAAMANLDTQTDMYDVYTSTCGTSTDILWIRNDSMVDPYGNPARGVTNCLTWASWGVCDQYWIQFNQLEVFYEAVTYYPNDIGNNFGINMAKTLCHELGHSTGLVHNNDNGATGGGIDCMVSGPVPTSWYYDVYNAHHVGHVNAQY
jgi:hypothetical protein